MTISLAICLLGFCEADLPQDQIKRTMTENMPTAQLEIEVPVDEDAAMALMWAEIVAIDNDKVTVEVFIRNYVDLRGYEVAVELFGIDEEPPTLIDAVIDVNRPNYVFRDVQPFNAVNLEGAGRLAGALMDGGADGKDAAYLGTFVYRVSKAVMDQVSARVAGPERTLLRDSTARPIKYRIGGSSNPRVESMSADSANTATNSQQRMLSIKHELASTLDD